MVATSAETPGRDRSDGVSGLLRFSVGLSVVFAVFLFAFYPSIEWTVREWRGPSGVLSHGYLIAAISVYLFVRAVPRAAALSMRPEWRALPVLLALSIIWLLGYASTVVAVQTVILPAVLLAAIAVAFGAGVARVLAFPVLFLYFAVPAVSHLQFVFQAITVFAVSILVRLADIPALVQGNFVVIPQGTFEIAGGCSGLNFVIAGSSLAVFYGHLFYDKLRNSLLLVLLTVLVAMIGNWLRVFLIILLGYRTDMQSPLVDDHHTLGWVLFVVLMIPVYLFARRLEAKTDRSVNAPAAPGKAGRYSVHWAAVIVAVVSMAAGPVWAKTVATSERSGQSVSFAFPQGQGDWRAVPSSGWGWQPKFTRPSYEDVVEYESNDGPVLVYANVYLAQKQDRELIYFSNDVKGDWSKSSTTPAKAKTVDLGGGLQFRQVVANNYVGDWLIWYRYQHGTAYDVSETRAKLNQAVETLQGRPEAGVVVFATLCGPNCEPGEARLSKFVRQIGAEIDLGIVRELR